MGKKNENEEKSDGVVPSSLQPPSTFGGASLKKKKTKEKNERGMLIKYLFWHTAF